MIVMMISHHCYSAFLFYIMRCSINQEEPLKTETTSSTLCRVSVKSRTRVGPSPSTRRPVREDERVRVSAQELEYLSCNIVLHFRVTSRNFKLSLKSGHMICEIFLSNDDLFFQ